MTRTPAELRAAADLLEERVVLAVRRGWHVRATELAAEAVLLREEAEAASVLPNTKRRAKVTGMTDAQKADRAGAIAKARTRGTRDRLQRAIQASEWKTHNRYARERLSISPGMLTGYKNGTYPVPSGIADLVRLDFKLTLPLK